MRERALRWAPVSPLVVGIALLALPAAASDPGADRLRRELEAARRSFEPGRLESVQSELVARADAHPDDYGAQLAAGEAFLARATRLRNARTVGRVEGEEAERHRDLQAELGEQGLPFAERALELASDDPERAQAERVLGELYTHRIRGMLSGMLNGPRARGHVGRALELAPEDVECRRAIGLMYLHNPPFTGGDVEKAIETFRENVERRPDDDAQWVLLGMAYRKDGQADRAREAAERALAANPANADARALLAALE